MYEVSVKTHFSAAHHLRGYHGSCEEHHGHNWDVEVFVRGESLDKTGILVDFRELKKVLRNLLAELDHKDLNRVKAFRKQNPTSENIARHLYQRLSLKLTRKGHCVSLVRVCETPTSSATYSEPDAMSG